MSLLFLFLPRRRVIDIGVHLVDSSVLEYLGQYFGQSSVLRKESREKEFVLRASGVRWRFTGWCFAPVCTRMLPQKFNYLLQLKPLSMTSTDFEQAAADALKLRGLSQAQMLQLYALCKQSTYHGLSFCGHT
eukprot:g37616.t1